MNLLTILLFEIQWSCWLTILAVRLSTQVVEFIYLLLNYTFLFGLQIDRLFGLFLSVYLIAAQDIHLHINIVHQLNWLFGALMDLLLRRVLMFTIFYPVLTPIVY